MSLKRLQSNGKLRRQESSAEEIADLIAVVDRDLEDASLAGLSPDRRFATAYNAALQLATIILRGQGYRTTGLGHHVTTLESLPLILGNNFREVADYFDTCRSKRNVTDYGRAGGVSESEADELLSETLRFRQSVLPFIEETIKRLS